jgi:hypothetical protein
VAADYVPKDGEVLYGNWSRSECFKVERGLLTFGWGRWKEFLANNEFRNGWTEEYVEELARLLVSYEMLILLKYL